MQTQPQLEVSPTVLAPVLEEFYRTGVAMVPGFLSRAECRDFIGKTDEIFADEEKRQESFHGNPFVISVPLLHHREWAELFMREPILSLMHDILGPECRFCGQHVIRNAPGQAISTWHVDDHNLVDFPLPADVPRHDARARMPVFWLSVQIALTDIESEADGPTEVVRTSHYSGRVPPTQDNPEFEAYKPEPMLCRAGDAYLFNHQVWHRGRPNIGTRTRYLMQLQYARGGTTASRFQGLASSPHLNEVLKDFDERTLRVLGRTAPTYGL